MEKPKPILQTFENSNKLLLWFIEKVNFKISRILWLAKPKLNWNDFSVIVLRTIQLLFTIPAISADLLIIFASVILYLLSFVLIFFFFLIYALVLMIFDKAVSPVLKITGIAAGFTILFLIYKPQAWEIISGRLSELWQLWFS